MIVQPWVPMQNASVDPHLRGAPLAVYLWLAYNRLEDREWTSVKLDGVARAMKIKRHTASRALRLLIAGGYLARRSVGRAGYEYRLLVHRAEAAAA